MKACKRNYKKAGQFFFAFILLIPLIVSAFPTTLFTSQAYADANPIEPLDIVNGTCPSNTSFTMGDKTHAPSCYKDYPSSQNDCPAGSKFHQGGGGSSGQHNYCASAGDAPTGQGDCPIGSTYTPGAGGSSGINSSCVFPGTYPTKASDCPAGDTFHKGNLVTPNTCSNPSDNPTSQGDCTPSGTIYKAGAGGSSGIGGSCVAASQAAVTYCSGKTGADLSGCLVGYDTQSCTGLSGSALNSCQAAATAAGAGTDNKQLGCDTQLTNPLTWVLCPIVDALVQIINFIDNLITDQLTVNTSNIFCNNNATCAAYHTAWATFRDIALGFMVIAGLIIVISQALGFELLDAYTIRKTLPRLLVASIAITLSWPLMQFFVSLTNDLGFGIRHLIYAPFSKLSGTLDLSFSNNGIANFFFSGISTAAVGTFAAINLWVAGGGIGILLAYAGTAGLAVLIAIFVLILRQVAIILLIILAPLALVAYILPNTQRAYHLWWESFSKALLMFPLIAAFIATGRVFSAIAIHNGGAVNQLIGFIAYFAPYFLIPATFKLAGGAVRQIGGFVNDRSRGGFDALRNKRKASSAERRKAAHSGGLYRNKMGKFSYRSPFIKNAETNKRHLNPKKWGKKETSMDNLLNTATNYGIDLGDSGRVLAGTRGGAVGRALFGRPARSLKDKIRRARIEHTLKGAQELQGRYHSARAVAGLHGYYYEGLNAEGKQALLDNFGVGEKDADGHLSEASWKAQGGKWRGSDNEKEHLKLASIYEQGGLGDERGQGAREAAVELSADASKLDHFKGAGKDETQRADVKYMAMMVAATAGRLENSDLANYYNEMAERGEQEEAYLRLKQLQNMAAPKRPSQAEGYGLEFRPVSDGKGGTRMEAYDVYEDPTEAAAQSSFGKTSAAEIGNAKAEDLKDPEGDLSGWSQTIIAATSEYKMKRVPLMDPKTGRQKLDPRTNKGKWKVEPVTQKQNVPVMGADGKTPLTDDRGNVLTKDVDMPVRKEGQALRDAIAAQGKIQSIEGYAQGDTGVGGQIYRIMEEAKIPYRFGNPFEAREAAANLALNELRQQEAAQAPPDPLRRDQGGPGNTPRIDPGPRL